MRQLKQFFCSLKLFSFQWRHGVSDKSPSLYISRRYFYKLLSTTLLLQQRWSAFTFDFACMSLFTLIWRHTLVRCLRVVKIKSGFMISKMCISDRPHRCEARRRHHEWGGAGQLLQLAAEQEDRGRGWWSARVTARPRHTPWPRQTGHAGLRRLWVANISLILHLRKLAFDLWQFSMDNVSNIFKCTFSSHARRIHIRNRIRER